MRALTINGEPWGVIRVRAGDPRLIDRTGSERLATTNPVTRVIAIRADVQPPLLDKVLLHEIAHAVTVSWGLLPYVRSHAMRGDLTGIEEWAAQLVENHALEAVIAASEALGRPICVRGDCLG